MSLRRAIRGVQAVLFGCGFVFASIQLTHGADPIACRGMCDASAVASPDAEHFVVADDESSVLRAYSLKTGGDALASFDLAKFLRVDPNSPESDIEGAAQVDGNVYWIGSHGRDKKGRERASRQRFFATRLSISNGIVSLTPAGQPYTNLLRDLVSDAGLERFHLQEASARPPKTPDALNIEALCETSGGALFIGFRNPIPQGKALLAPLLNPSELIFPGTNSARFGPPVLLDLGGFGVQGMARSLDRYLILAGSYAGGGESRLYEWRGGNDSPRQIDIPELKGLNPEAIEFIPATNPQQILVASDDGNLEIGGEKCKDQKDPRFKYFRITVIRP